MNILILEEDRTSYDILCGKLVQMLHNCTFYGPLTTVNEGKRFFAENKERIDLIVADVQLRDGLCFYALNEAPADVPVIFTSSTEEYAFNAFSYNSLSYLLKPVTDAALEDALNKAQQRLITDEHRKELMAMVAKHARYRERFFVKTFKGERIIRLSQVRYVMSENKSTYLILHDGSTCEFDKPLNALIKELDPKHFMRVNRQYIIPAREVERFERGTNGKEFLIMRGDHAPEVIVSRENKRAVHQWLNV